MSALSLVGNILFFIFGGFVTALLWFIGGLVALITVVGAPLFRLCMNNAKMALAPFGKDVVKLSDLKRAKGEDQHHAGLKGIGVAFNIIWFFTFGMMLFITHVISGIALFIPIFTIPFGLQHFKLAVTGLFPAGRRVVTISEANVIHEELAKIKLNINK